MSTKSLEKIFLLLGIVLIIGLIISLFKKLNRSVETKVISDKGLAALKDPEAKKKINDAIDEAIKKQQETGVWEDPVVNLN